MKAIFYAVAILVTGGAAFFSYSHSQKFDALEKDRMATIATEKDTASKEAVAKTNIKVERDNLAKSKERRELLTQSVSQLKSEGSGLQNDNTKLAGELKAQDVEFAELEKTLKAVNESLVGMGSDVTLENLPEKIEEVNKDLASKRTKLEELQTLVGAAEKTLASSRAEMDRQAKRAMERNGRIGRNSMTAVVTAVNQEWGFLVIGAGSNSGFTPQTALIVERDGRKIGSVRPTSIEPTQTIADIDMDSLGSGVRIQPGDRVILAKPASN